MVGLHRDLAKWKISPRQALALFLVPIVITLTLAIGRALDRDLAFAAVEEDHVVEWLQFAGYAAAGVLAAMSARTFLGRRDAFRGAACLIFAIGCLFIAGEEIAWGQRLLEFETSSALKEVNTQGAETVHNVDALQRPFQGALLLIGLYGMVIPCALCFSRVRRLVAARARQLDFLVPPIFLTSSFLVLAVHKLILAAGFDDTAHNQFYGEAEELVLAFALAVFAWLGWRRLRVPRYAAVREVAFQPASMPGSSP
jgi:hypothetical protein